MIKKIEVIEVSVWVLLIVAIVFLLMAMRADYIESRPDDFITGTVSGIDKTDPDLGPVLVTIYLEDGTVIYSGGDPIGLEEGMTCRFYVEERDTGLWLEYFE